MHRRHATLGDAVRRMHRQYIMSVSGIRAIFAATEHGRRRSIAKSHAVIIALLVQSYLAVLSQKGTVAVATDSRPTRNALATIVLRTISANGYRVRYLAVTAIPQLMAYTASYANIVGFVYITASHNPIGYNGLKFGNASGAVLERQIMEAVLRRYTQTIDQDSEIHAVYDNIITPRAPQQKTAQTGIDALQRHAAHAYRAQIMRIVQGSDNLRAWSSFCKSIYTPNTHVAIDYNGSARISAIDSALLATMVRHIHTYGTKIGVMKRAIEPEGEALAYLAKKIEQLYAKQHTHQYIGYMCDNDGDRGNIVFWSQRESGAVIIEPQQLFALLTAIRLSLLTMPTENRSSPPTKRLAIVANGPTSQRIDEIAARFNVQVYRTEVGEANVIQARDTLLRAKQIVALAGEGSNGGCIVSPSSVRDPLVTIVHMLIFLHYNPSTPTEHAAQFPNLFAKWCAITNTPYHAAYTIDDMLHSLPQYKTTQVTDDEATLHTARAITDRHRVKYIEIVIEQIGAGANGLSNIPCASFSVTHFHGATQTVLLDARCASLTQKRKRSALNALIAQLRAEQRLPYGGLKITLYDKQRRYIASLWWRASGTEQKVRMIIDVPQQFSDYYMQLVRWQKSMVQACIDD